MKRARSLRSHLMLLYVMLAVLSGIIVPIGSIHITLVEFRGYLMEKRRDDVERLVESLVALYHEDNAWKETRLRDVLRQGGYFPVFAVLYDADGTLVFPSKINSRIQKSIDEFNQDADGDERASLKTGMNKIPMRSGNNSIGTLFLSLPPPPEKTETVFAARIGHRAFSGAVLMIALAFLLGFFVSERLSRPVLRAAEHARRISRGDYDATPEKPSGIREMDALSRSVTDLGHSLGVQEKLRKRLMVDVAHELRTPLTVVKSQIEALADGVWEASPERLALCVKETDRLSDLIMDVERLSGLEGEFMNICTEKRNLSEFLAEILESFKRLFDRDGILLTWQLAPNITAEIDAGRFRHVIENLLSNALRYTEAGGKVQVRLDTCEGNARIAVEDSGAGIAPADLPHIFDRFYRADTSRTRETGGRGVGLSITKAAVEAHGGSVSVESAPGEGSLFTVLLPESTKQNGGSSCTTLF